MRHKFNLFTFSKSDDIKLRSKQIIKFHQLKQKVIPKREMEYVEYQEIEDDEDWDWLEEEE